MDEGFGDRWGRQVRGWIDTAVQRTEEIAQVSRRQVELLQIEWDLLRRRAEVGERVLRLIEQGELAGWSRDPHLVDHVEEARALEGAQRRVKGEIEAIRKGVTSEDEAED